MSLGQRISPTYFFIRLLVILFFSVYGVTFSFAQTRLVSCAFQMNEGFIAPHHAYMRYLVKGHVVSGNLETLWQNNKNKYWKTAYHFPLTGWGIYYANLGNPAQLGNVFAIYKKVEISFGESERFKYHFNGGISYLTNHFDIENNYFNTVVGSNINVFFRLGLMVNLIKIKSCEVYTDLTFIHYSNGNYYEPNAGINVANIGIGIRPQIAIKTNEPNKEMIDNAYYKFLTEVVVAGSVKSIPQEINKNYFAGSVVLNEIYRPNFKNAFDIGMDMFYDASAKYSAIYQEIDDFNNADYYRMGVHIGYEPQFGKTSISIQMGVYLYDKMHIETPLFHRVALKQEIYNGLTLGVAIKTHFFKAEFIEWGIGYRFLRKKHTEVKI